jgi:hypothetical protein
LCVKPSGHPVHLNVSGPLLGAVTAPLTLKTFPTSRLLIFNLLMNWESNIELGVFILVFKGQSEFYFDDITIQGVAKLLHACRKNIAK